MENLHLKYFLHYILVVFDQGAEEDSSDDDDDDSDDSDEMDTTAGDLDSTTNFAEEVCFQT